MPHKMNSRSCERVNGFHTLLKGYVAMAAGLAGDQWNEGDVSCSVVRRVLLPDAFFALDGLFETFLTILNQMEVFAMSVQRENERYLPFLLTTTFMMEAVRRGVGRETAHEAIKEHATATMRDLRSGTTPHNDLLDRLAADARLGLSRADLDAAFARGQEATGAADSQVATTVAAMRAAAASCPDAARYQPGEIL
jgi:adenylosuccinate lyase